MEGPRLFCFRVGCAVDLFCADLGKWGPGLDRLDDLIPGDRQGSPTRSRCRGSPSISLYLLASDAASSPTMGRDEWLFNVGSLCR
jgi:hypothetical protein